MPLLFASVHQLHLSRPFQLLLPQLSLLGQDFGLSVPLILQCEAKAVILRLEALHHGRFLLFGQASEALRSHLAFSISKPLSDFCGFAL
jgi:hypothetical protein